MWMPTLKFEGSTYAAIVEALRADTASGLLKPGMQLPTQRELAARLGVSLGTVTRAYRIAMVSGLIDAQVGRGTFVAHPMISKSDTSNFVHLATGFTDLSLDRPLDSLSPDLGETLARLAKRRNVNDLLAYQPPEGTARHREAGAAWLRRFGVDCSPDNVVLCNGSQHAISVIFAACTKPGDVILCEELTYPGMKAAASMMGLRLQPVSMDGNGILPNEFERLCKSRRPRAAYLTPGLQNPTNAQLSEARRSQIAKSVRKHDLILIEDEVREQSATNSPKPLWTWVPEQTCFIGGVSKSLGGGLRIAYMAAPTAQLSSLQRAVWTTSWTVSSLTLEVAATWMEDGTADETLRRKTEEAKRRQALARRLLSNWTIRSLPASYTVWLELPSEVTVSALLIELQNLKIRVSPAEVFHVGDRQSPNAVRISLGAADTYEQLAAALKKIRDALNNYHVETAIGVN